VTVFAFCDLIGGLVAVPGAARRELAADRGTEALYLLGGGVFVAAANLLYISALRTGAISSWLPPVHCGDLGKPRRIHRLARHSRCLGPSLVRSSSSARALHLLSRARTAESAEAREGGIALKQKLSWPGLTWLDRATSRRASARRMEFYVRLGARCRGHDTFFSRSRLIRPGDEDFLDRFLAGEYARTERAFGLVERRVPHREFQLFQLLSISSSAAPWRRPRHARPAFEIRAFILVCRRAKVFLELTDILDVVRMLESSLVRASS